jgi:hypothetical protein
MIRARRAVGRAAVGMLAAVALGFLWLSSFAASAEPSDALSITSTLICDTPEEVSAYVRRDPNEEISAALARVNNRFGEEACNFVTTLFKKGEQADTVLIPEGIICITKIEILGAVANGSLMRLATPQTQYAPMFEKATSV